MSYFVELFTDISDFSISDYELEFDLMPIARQKRTLKFANEIERKLSVIAYKLLREGLYKHYDISNGFALKFNEFDKPYLRDHNNVFFNLSHCNNAVACVFSNSEIGVDVENIIAFDNDLAKRICSFAEYERIIKSANSNIELTKLWTQKESYLKMLSNGLVDDLTQVLNDETLLEIKFETAITESYILTICHKTNS